MQTLTYSPSTEQCFQKMDFDFTYLMNKLNLSHPINENGKQTSLRILNN